MRLRCLMGVNSGRALDYSYLAGKAALAAGNAELIDAEKPSAEVPKVEKPQQTKQKRRRRRA